MNNLLLDGSGDTHREELCPISANLPMVCTGSFVCQPQVREFGQEIRFGWRSRAVSGVSTSGCLVERKQPTFVYHSIIRGNNGKGIVNAGSVGEPLVQDWNRNSQHRISQELKTRRQLIRPLAYWTRITERGRDG